MRKLIVGISCAGTAIIGSATGIVRPGSRRERVVGDSVAANGHAIHSHGGLISAFAPRNDLGTLADAVHALQAGQIPDEVFANTCN